MVNSQRGATITSPICNKREWNNCLIKFLKLQKFGSMKYEERKSERNRKNLMKMRCCVIPRGQTDVGSSLKHFFPFRVLIKIGIDRKFLQKKFFFFSFLALFREKFRFPANTFLA